MKHFVAFVLMSTLCVAAPAGAIDLGSDWHSDPDGDAITTSDDLCPWVYDPDQSDSDFDDIGDACDPDFAPPTNGGAISDLHAEHITPYGGWFSFTSPHSTTWGWTATIVWSTDPDELTTVAGFTAAYDRGDAVEFAVSAAHGESLVRPVFITSLEPATRYYAAATRVNWNGLDNAIGPVITFLTADDPSPALTNVRPRVAATGAQISAAQSRRNSSDTSWWTWENLMQPRVEQAASDPASVYHARHYCSTAALLYLASGDSSDLSDAQVLLQENITYWQDNDLTSNYYRWEDSQLAYCLDLLWDHLDTATREAAVAAFLEEDEAHVAEGLPRVGDTDEFASITRNWIVDGLTACQASGIDPTLAERSCAVLDAGLRLWHGVQLVKARRDRGFWAQSGGFLPDGSDYGQGTSRYWMQSFLALDNVGASAAPYWDFVRNHLASMVLQLFSPTQLGFATAGDVEDFSYNWSVEKNSFQLEQADAGLLTMQAAVLDAASDGAAASWARYAANALYEDQSSTDGWYRLLFEADNRLQFDHRLSLSNAHLDSGMGIFTDRSSWSEEASMLFVRAGWSGVDHSHGDIGHFQLFREGRWMTHEAIGYDGTAASGRGHNVLLLQTPDEGIPTEPGQNRYASAVNRIIRASSDEYHAALTADITGAYTAFDQPERYYDRVQRSLVWLKTDEDESADRLIVHDLIHFGPDAPPGLVSRWQLQVDEAPVITDSRAEIVMPRPTPAQRLTVDVLLPEDAVLSSIAPEGPPDTYPAEVYTYRLLADTATSDSERVFLTMMQANDDGIAAATPGTIESATADGALVGGDLVVFAGGAQDWSGGGAQTLNVIATTTEALRVFVLGMEPGAGFAVSANQDGASLSLDITPGSSLSADQGGLIAFTVDAARNVQPMYPAGVVFLDGFEDSHTDAWSIVVQ